jgi:tetratricopeptide (TPR) repeat protein
VSIKNFYEAEEVVGQHVLGSQISFSDTNNSLISQINLNRELSRRSQLLSLLTKGLSLYSIHAYEDSYNYFKQANDQEFWQNENGREVAYLFEGNAAGKSFNFDEAEDALLKAIQIEPEYSRAYAGLGSIYYLLAFKDITSQNSIPSQIYLQKSTDYYNKALSAQIQPESADISTKVSFGLGQVNLTYWYLGENTLDNAISLFSNVISEYQNNNNERIQEIAIISK